MSIFGCDCGEEDCGYCGPHVEASRNRRSPKPKKRKLTWTTKDGRVLEPRNMETTHIQNCMELLERRKFEREIQMLCLPGPNGEHAQDAFESELMALADASVAEVFPIYAEFERELARRSRAEARTKVKARKKVVKRLRKRVREVA